MKKYDFIVFMGRFQPLHSGHISVINHALSISKNVIVLVGSANMSRSPRNPFTFKERENMIAAAIMGADIHTSTDTPVIVRPIHDFTYNDKAWIANVQKTVHDTILETINPSKTVTLHGLHDVKIGIVGRKKDHTSYYLDLFPEWDTIDVGTGHPMMSATDFRAAFLHRTPLIPSRPAIPMSVCDFLYDFTKTVNFQWLVEEAEFYKQYKHSWRNAPFAPFISCVDAVAVQSGYILLVNRKHCPGQGLLALPGGHVNENETFRSAVIRELKEETKIADNKGEIPPAMLASFIEDTKTRLFDSPNRSERGRVITQAYYFNLPDRPQLFSVRGDDDAAYAEWYELGRLKSSDFFEDHAAIISEMTGYNIGD